MLQNAFNNLATHLFVPKKTADIARASVLMVDTLDGFGSGVLIAPNIALTSAHNFDGCLPTDAMVLSPSTKRKSAILEAELLYDLDLAFLTLKNPIQASHAQIDGKADISRVFGLIAPRFFNPKNLNYRALASLVCPFEDTIRRGFLIEADMKPPQLERTMLSIKNADQLDERGSQMFLGAIAGDSGAGVFSKAGQLITIINHGNTVACTGPSLGKFRRAVLERGIGL